MRFVCELDDTTRGKIEFAAQQYISENIPEMTEKEKLDEVEIVLNEKIINIYDVLAEYFDTETQKKLRKAIF